MKLKVVALSFFATILFVSSCRKKYELPPEKEAPAVSSYITIDTIVKRYEKYYKTMTFAPTKVYRFTGDVNLVCTVTADETSGNIYKTVFVADSTAAITIKLINSGGLAVGDKIRINLNNAVLDDYGAQIQLDSIDIEKRVVKISSGNPVVPTKMTFAQMNTKDSKGLLKYQSRLVLVDSVEFAANDKGQQFADPINKFSIDRELLNSVGNSVVVRNSGYANFAGSIIPCGKGSLVAIVGEYNGTTQMTIRDHKEVKLSSGGCPFLVKNFKDGSLTNGGWTNHNVLGTINWVWGKYYSDNYAEISNYVSGNQACETWFISPALNILGAPSPYFSFRSAYNYTGPALQVLVSTNYTSGNPTLATWTALSPNLSTGGYQWANSGKLNLTPYISANTRIAFKYSGTSTSGSTWEVDDIAIFVE